jgi:hypothetical protein
MPLPNSGISDILPDFGVLDSVSLGIFGSTSLV